MKIDQHNLSQTGAAGLAEQTSLSQGVNGGSSLKSPYGFGSDSVQLLSLSAAVRAYTTESPDRASSLAKLGQDVQSGKYRVDPQAVSEGVINDALLPENRMGKDQAIGAPDGTAKEATKSFGAEWFAAFLPKFSTQVGVKQAEAAPVLEVVPTDRERERRVQIAAVRAEIEAISSYLIDPSAEGVRAAIPHLEKAIETLSGQAFTAASDRPTHGLEELRSELARANRLFEQAYELHAVWATQLGINMDGTPRQLLYERPGGPETWKG